MAPFKVISFDCDGVLFDSKRANEEYYGRLARDFGRDRLTPDEIEFVHTHTVFQSVDHVFRETPEVIEAVHKVRAERGYGPFVKLMVPAPGIYDCLAELGRALQGDRVHQPDRHDPYGPQGTSKWIICSSMSSAPRTWTGPNPIPTGCTGPWN